MDAARLSAARALTGLVVAFALLLAAVAGAQPAPGKVARVAVLTIGVNPRSTTFNAGFEGRLRELGWIDGKTVSLQWRAPKPGQRLVDLAAAVVREGVDVIVAPGPEAPLQAARDATARVPIVMIAINYDPVERGYVASLARPGANITGLFYRQFEVGAKQVELLAQVLPAASRLGVLWDTASADQLKALEVAARTLRIEPMPIEIRSSDDYEAAIATLQRSRVAGVIVAGSPLFFRDRARIHQLLSKHRLPSAGAAGYVDAGPLISYGPDLVYFFSRGADYVDRILRGARPADLPVEQPTRFELTINLRTAKALGVTVPPALLARADTIVE